MEGISVGQIMQVGAWGLGLGTAFFSFFGIKADRDFFLVIGLLCCTIGNSVFAWFLMEQEGKRNETFITFYVLLALLSLYSLYCQLDMYRKYGFVDDDEDEEEPTGGATETSLLLKRAAGDVDAAARRARLEERIKEYKAQMQKDGLLPAGSNAAGAGLSAASSTESNTASAAAGGEAAAVDPPESKGLRQRKLK